MSYQTNSPVAARLSLTIGDRQTQIDRNSSMTLPADAHNPAARHTMMPSAPSLATSLSQAFVSGSGFLPDHLVTLRITTGSDDIADYLTYTTDVAGALHAPLPPSSAVRLLRIAATDHRCDPGSEDGLLWSNICTISIGDW